MPAKTYLAFLFATGVLMLSGCGKETPKISLPTESLTSECNHTTLAGCTDEEKSSINMVKKRLSDSSPTAKR